MADSHTCTQLNTFFNESLLWSQLLLSLGIANLDSCRLILALNFPEVYYCEQRHGLSLTGL